jgi:hypothetical protein
MLRLLRIPLLKVGLKAPLSINPCLRAAVPTARPGPGRAGEGGADSLSVPGLQTGESNTGSSNRLISQEIDDNINEILIRLVASKSTLWCGVQRPNQEQP